MDSAGRSSCSSSSSAAPHHVPYTPLNYIRRVWLQVSGPGSQWSSGLMESSSIFSAGPSPQLQQQQGKEGCRVGSPTRGGLKSSGFGVAAKQLRQPCSRSREKCLQTMSSSNSSSSCSRCSSSSSNRCSSSIRSSSNIQSSSSIHSCSSSSCYRKQDPATVAAA